MIGRNPFRPVELPMIIACPFCKATNVRTSRMCRQCEKNLEDSKKRMLSDLTDFRNKDLERRKDTKEENIGYIPLVAAEDRSGPDVIMMEGFAILTTGRIVCGMTKEGGDYSWLGMAAPGGIIADVIFGGLKDKKDQISADLPPDDILRRSEASFEIPFDSLLKMDGRVSRTTVEATFLMKTYPGATEESVIQLVFAIPERVIQTRRAEGMSKGDARDQYKGKITQLLNGALASAGIRVTWHT